MELKSLTRDMAAIEQGRWVDATEVPAMGDMRLKMRGSGSDAFRLLRDGKVRDGAEFGAATVAVVHEFCLVDVEGLTNGGKPVTVGDLRALLASATRDRFDPFGLILLDAMQAVDATREAKAIALSKN